MNIDHATMSAAHPKVRFSVHAHREVSPGCWYRAFVGAFEDTLTRAAVRTLLDFAKAASNCDPVAFYGIAQTFQRFQALYIGAIEADMPTLPFFIVGDMLKNEIRVVVEDPTLQVPDSVLQRWTLQTSEQSKPTTRVGELPT